jgi:hypothetical protein
MTHRGSSSSEQQLSVHLYGTSGRRNRTGDHQSGIPHCILRRTGDRQTDRPQPLTRQHNSVTAAAAAAAAAVVAIIPANAERCDLANESRAGGFCQWRLNCLETRSPAVVVVVDRPAPRSQDARQGRGTGGWVSGRQAPSGCQ